MSSLSQFGGGSRAPRSLVQLNSAASWSGVGAIATTADAAAGAKQVASGALTANTLATALNISGAGQLQYLSIWSADATSRTLRLVLTIDGVSVYDYTSAAISTANSGGVIVGSFNAAGNIVTPEFVEFKTSLVVQIASSITETNKIGISYKYRTY